MRVRKSGEISTVAVFPDRLVDAPPGFPFVPGAANVYRVEPGSEPEVYASGFTNITGLDFDRHGRLYVVEFAANGILSGDPTDALIRVDTDGTPETLVSEGLVNPTGIAIGRKGDVYVSNHGAEAGAGEVVRFRF